MEANGATPIGEHLLVTVLNGRIHVLGTGAVVPLHEFQEEDSPRATQHHVYDILQDTWSSNVLPSHFRLNREMVNECAAALTACEHEGRLVLVYAIEEAVTRESMTEEAAPEEARLVFETYDAATEAWQGSVLQMPEYLGIHAVWTITLG